LGRIDLLPSVRSNLEAEDPGCRFSAAWSGALLGDMQAIPALRSVAKLDVPYKEEAAKMALRRMDLPTAHGWQSELAQSPDFIRLAVKGNCALAEMYPVF
jgi:HEAT repeat protein